MRTRPRRSTCPIAFSLDLFGDRWTLLILRDMVFLGRRYYQEFLEAGEGIATNVLADRLDRLERAGLIGKSRDPANRRRYRYTLTDRGLDTLPVLAEMILWGGTYDPESGVPEDVLRRLREDRDGYLADVRAARRQKGIAD